MLLSEARTRARRYVDREGDTDLFVDGEVDDELKAAFAVAWRLVGDKTNLWTQETTLSTDANGVADLSSIKPLRLVSVAITAAGLSRWTLKPARPVDGLTNVPLQQSLRISYVPRGVFPAAAGDAFDWGPSVDIDTDLLDRLVCLLAAAALKVKENERNQVLEKQVEQARFDVKSMLSVPRYSVTALDAALRRWTSPYFYIMTAADTLQVVA